MPNLVVVAIPSADDPVWQISSEKVPHMTILFLGENADHPQKVKMAGYIAHAAITSLCRFGLEVGRRGTLGEDEADVVFFEDSWELPKLQQFRTYLLKDNNINAAHLASGDKFPDWAQPHLTLGYPASPAKKAKDPFSDKLYYVQFDRIALWDGDYEGTEIVLPRYSYANYDNAMAMNDTADAGAEFLAHFGVKGMRWGVRRSQAEIHGYKGRRAEKRTGKELREPTEVQTISDIGRLNSSKTKIHALGGENHPASEDALKTADARQKLRRSGVNALSNKELQDLQTRLTLETNVTRLDSQRPATKGRKFVESLTKDPVKTVDSASAFISEYNKTKGHGT